MLYTSILALDAVSRWRGTPLYSLQGSGMDKVLGRGRGSGVLEQVLRARVLKRRRAAPELSR